MLSLNISRVGHRAALVAGTLALVLTVACSDDATAPKTAAVTASASPAIQAGPLLPDDLPPIADGVIATGEYVGAQMFTMPVRLTSNTLGSGTTAKVYVTHDQTYLYLAVTFDRKSRFRSREHVAFEFDLDNDGVRDIGDDIVGLNALSSTPWDYVWYSAMNNASDYDVGGTNDATGAFGAAGNIGVFEIRKKLDSGDGHDMVIQFMTGARTIGMRSMIVLDAMSPGYGGAMLTSWSPSQSTYCELTLGKHFTAFECP